MKYFFKTSIVKVGLCLSLTLTSGCMGCRVVHVPEPAPLVVPMVDITGDVAHAMAIPVDAQGLKLWSAIIRAGGVIGEENGRTFVSLHRTNRKYHFALSLVEGRVAGDIQLSPGDVICVQQFDDISPSRAFLSHSAVNAEFRTEAAAIHGGRNENLPTLLAWESHHRIGDGVTPNDRPAFTAELAEVVGELDVPPRNAAKPEAGPADSTELPPLGICDLTQQLADTGEARTPIASTSDTVVLDPDGNAAMALVVSRDATVHHADRELVVVPSSLLAGTLNASSFDPAILSGFQLRQGDAVGAVNLEHLPIVASSLLAPYVKAQQDLIRNQALEASMVPHVPFDGVPVFGTVSHCLCEFKEKYHSTTVRTYSTRVAVELPPRVGAPYVTDQFSAVP